MSTSEEKSGLFKEKLKEMLVLFKDSDNFVNEMFDVNTWGSRDWTENFIERTQKLQDNIRDIERKIENYLRQYN